MTTSSHLRLIALTAACFSTIAAVSATQAASSSAVPQERDSESIEMVSDTGRVDALEIDRAPRVQHSTDGTHRLSDLVGDLLPTTIPQHLASAARPDPPPYTTVTPPADLLPPSGGLDSMSVIGVDDRVRVAEVEASPHIQTPFIGYQHNGQTYMCTGFLIGPYAIATAAHCLYQQGTASSQMAVYFGLNGTTAVAGCTTDHFAFPSQWAASERHEYDWGVVQLNCNAGEVFGHYGYMNPGSHPSSAGFHVTGYPSDKKSGDGFSMWQATGSIDIGDDRKLWYRIDSSGGQSGGPIWFQSGTDCGNCVVGVHAYGVSPSLAYPGYNSGSRITDEVASVFATYRSGWVHHP